MAGRQVDSLSTFKSPTGAEAPHPGGVSAKKKVGRPEGSKKLPPPLPPRKIEAPVKPSKPADEIESDRRDFEELLTEIMVATTDDLADERFVILKQVHPESVARAQADKARLTPIEKKYFSKVAMKLWAKYIDDQFNFTEESMAMLLAFRYYMRNREPSRLIKQIIKNGQDQRPELRREPDTNLGRNGNGEVHSGGAPNPPLAS